jgi:hypothetical protein
MLGTSSPELLSLGGNTTMDKVLCDMSTRTSASIASPESFKQMVMVNILKTFQIIPAKGKLRVGAFGLSNNTKDVMEHYTSMWEMLRGKHDDTINVIPNDADTGRLLTRATTSKDLYDLWLANYTGSTDTARTDIIRSQVWLILGSMRQLRTGGSLVLTQGYSPSVLPHMQLICLLAATFDDVYFYKHHDMYQAGRDGIISYSIVAKGFTGNSSICKWAESELWDSVRRVDVVSKKTNVVVMDVFAGKPFPSNIIQELRLIALLNRLGKLKIMCASSNR